MMNSKWYLSAAAFAGLLVQGTASAQQPVVVQPAPQGAPVVLDYYNGYDNGGDNCRGGGLIAGFEWVIVKPHFDRVASTLGESLREADDDDDVLVTLPETQVGPTFDMSSSPRFWIGFAGQEGFGGRFRYWKFDQSSDTASFTLNGEEAQDDPSEASPTEYKAGLLVEAIDLEFLQQGDVGRILLTGSAGVRRGRVRYDTETKVTQPFAPGGRGTDGSIDILLGESDFRGWGPTVALEAKRPFGGGLLALFVNGRGSLLYGHTQGKVTMGLTNDPLASPPTFSRALEDNDVVYVLETQIGAEVARETNRGSRLFLRIALEAQFWGGALLHQNFPNPRAFSQDASFDFERYGANDSLGMVGLTLGAGIGY
jgi:hypothetical protein